MSKQALYRDCQKEFKSQYGDIVITRDDFETLPCGMIAIEFSDDKMLTLVDNINLTMKRDCSKEELDLLKKFREREGKGLSEEEFDRADALSGYEFQITEDTAVAMGMDYYEDLTPESYDDICAATQEGRNYYDKVKA